MRVVYGRCRILRIIVEHFVLWDFSNIMENHTVAFIFSIRIQRYYWSHHTSIIHCNLNLNSLPVVLSKDTDFEVRCNNPVILQCTKSSFLPNQHVEGHANPLELWTALNVLAGNHQQSGKVDPGIFVGLDLESFPVPGDGLDCFSSERNVKSSQTP